MSTMNEATQLVQKLMQEKGVSEETAKLAPGHWTFKLGSFQFEIRLNTFQQLGKTQEGIVVVGLIMPLPSDETKRSLLQTELLTINSQIVGAWFGIHNDYVILVSSRQLDNLDYGELLQMADTVSLLGDYFDDELKNKY